MVSFTAGAFFDVPLVAAASLRALRSKKLAMSACECMAFKVVELFVDVTAVRGRIWKTRWKRVATLRESNLEWLDKASLDRITIYNEHHLTSNVSSF